MVGRYVPPPSLAFFLLPPLPSFFFFMSLVGLVCFWLLVVAFVGGKPEPCCQLAVVTNVQRLEPSLLLQPSLLSSRASNLAALRDDPALQQ